MRIPRLLIADDHRAVTEGLVQLLGKRFEIVATIHDGRLVVDAVLRLQPDVTLLDLSMPNVNGFEALLELKKRNANIKVIILTMYGEPGLAVEALKMGASGFVLKHKSSEELLTALKAVLSGNTYLALDLRKQVKTWMEEPTDARAPHRHEILFCPDDAAIVDGLTRFLAAALNAGDAALALVTESHRPRLLQRLRTQGVDIDGAIERGTYLSLDADEAPDPVRFLEAINGVRRAAATAGKARPRVAFCGERAGRLWAAGRTAEAAQLEQLCSELAQDVDILCIYPVSYTKDDQALAHICAEHTAASTG